MTRSRGLRRRPLAAALLWLCALVPLAGPAAQEIDAGDRKVTVNYVYASQLGIGTYDVGGLSVDVYSLPLSLERPLNGMFGLEVPGEHAGDWSVDFKFPVSYGIFDFEADDPTYGDIDIQQQTLALVPGLQVNAKLTDNWWLRPSVDLGLGGVVSTSGQEAAGDRYFMIYTAGLTSLYELPEGPYTFALGNGVTFAGNRTFGTFDLNEQYWAVETGLQVRRSLGFELGQVGLSNTAFAEVEPELGAYFIHYYFPEPLEFSRFLDTPLEVNNQVEFGLTMRSKTSWELLSLKDPKIGASYLFGDGLRVFRVNFGFPF